MTKDELHKVKCTHCDGDGWTAEHDPFDPHEYGCSNCPIQVQCEYCHGEGFFYLADEVRQAITEALEKQRESDKYFFERCLQFANETTTNDPLSFEEREYIINFCNTKLEEQGNEQDSVFDDDPETMFNDGDYNF